MSETTKIEVLEKLRRRYAGAGREHKSKLIDQARAILGYHRKSAIRALNQSGQGPVRRSTGRPCRYDKREILPVLRVIWKAASYPCGKRLEAMMPDWLAGYQAHVKGVSAGISEQLLEASARTLDRLVSPLRAQVRRRSVTRPGSLLRQQIPIRGSVWEEDRPGWLEVDTVALCGGRVGGDFVWMVDGVDIYTAWVCVRAMWNRGQAATLEALKDMEDSLPFPLLGLDSDNGGEFLNFHVLGWLQKRERPVYMTRSRPYKKDDNAHVEQKNWTHIRQWFGYERYDNPEVVGLLNELARGPYGQLLNYFHPTLKLKEKIRDEKGQIRRQYEAPQTPLSRVLALPEIDPETKTALQQEKARLNPFELKEEVERRLQKIESLRSSEGRASVSVGALEQVLAEPVHTRRKKVGGPKGRGSPTFSDRVPLGPQKKMAKPTVRR